MSQVAASNFDTSIAKKILQVMKKVQYLKKDGKVSSEKFGINYSYLSEGKITENIRTACIDAGLLIFPAYCEALPASETFAKVKLGYQIIDVDTGQTCCVEMIGLGQDKGDKSLYKALTGAYKYMQRQVFAIPTGDDPDKVCSEDTIAEIAAETKKPAIPQTPYKQVLDYVESHNLDKTKVKRLISDTFGKEGLKSLTYDETLKLVELLPTLH